MISLDEFKKLSAEAKWVWVYEMFANHLHQLGEVKWLVRILVGAAISGPVVIYLLK